MDEEHQPWEAGVLGMDYLQNAVGGEEQRPDFVGLLIRNVTHIM